MTGEGNQPVEQRLLAEWLAVRWPNNRVKLRVRVGADHPDLILPGLTAEELRMVANWRRWADAIIWADRELIVVEATVFPDAGKVSYLELYMRLVPGTPELAEWRDWPVRGIILMGIEDPLISRLAGERGLTVEIYHPRWIDSYLLSVAPRRLRAPLTVA
jgi:hypothetical protein